MQLPNLQFWREVLLAVFLAIMSAFVAMSPPFDHFGGISLALIAGMLTKALFWKPSSGSDGLAFAGKTLLRIGIVLLGLRLNFAILAHSGTQVVVFDLLMIILGITLIMFVLRRGGFELNLAILAAVGSARADAVWAKAPIPSLVRGRISVNGLAGDPRWLSSARRPQCSQRHNESTHPTDQPANRRFHGGDWSPGRLYPPAETWSEADAYRRHRVVAAIRGDLCALFDLEMTGFAHLSCFVREAF